MHILKYTHITIIPMSSSSPVAVTVMSVFRELAERRSGDVVVQFVLLGFMADGRSVFWGQGCNSGVDGAVVIRWKGWL